MQTMKEACKREEASESVRLRVLPSFLCVLLAAEFTQDLQPACVALASPAARLMKTIRQRASLKTPRIGNDTSAETTGDVIGSCI